MAIRDRIHNGLGTSVGDIAYLDQDMCLYIVDRKADLVISAGVNIYPAEVERTLEKHPEVKEAAVIGIPDPDWGEALKAFVILEPDAACSQDELIAYCTQHLARFKRPRSITFVDDFPRSPQGKVLKRILRSGETKTQP